LRNTLLKITLLSLLFLVLQPAITEAPIVEASKKVDLIKTKVPANCNDFRSEVEKYDWDSEIALQIMKLESSCNTEAVNKTDNHKVCVGSYGLMQIGCIHTDNVELLKEGNYNIKIAYEVYKKQGWEAWSVYSKIR